MARVIAIAHGGKPIEVNGVETVSDLKNQLNASDYMVLVNGQPAEDSQVLSDHDVCDLATKNKNGI